MINSRQNQDKVLKEFLRLCGVYGWNDKVLQDAVLKAGFTEGDEFFIFSGGVDGLIKFLVDKGNKEFEQKSQDLDLDSLKVRDRIKQLVKIRLLVLEKYKNSFKSLLVFSNSNKLGDFIRYSYEISDLIWSKAQDQVVDFSFYSKRIILSKIFLRTFLKFISSSNEETWLFLDNEIEKVMKFNNLKFKVRDCADLSNLKKNIAKLPFIRLFNQHKSY
jgi:ubiquinone biosynthesis protein COQ9